MGFSWHQTRRKRECRDALQLEVGDMALWSRIEPPDLLDISATAHLQGKADD